jgi:hypothetical protein
MTPGAEIFT